MYNHLKHTIQIVEEFNRVTLENAHVASETSTQATSHGGQGGGCQGRGCHGGCRAGRVNRLELEHANEDEDESIIEESENEGACDTYVDGVGTPQHMSNANARSSHTVGHEDTLPSQSTSCDDSEEHTSHTHASPRSLLPTRLSPSLFTRSTHEGGCIFVPTPGCYCCNKSSHLKQIRQTTYANKR